MRFNSAFKVLNIPVRAWRDGEGVMKLHSEQPACLSLLYWFFIASTHSNICINLCSLCFITTVLCLLPTRYSPEFSIIIKIKSNYFIINRFVFTGVSLVFFYLRPEFLHIISANFSVAYIPFNP